MFGVTDDDGTGVVGVSGDTIDSVGVYGTAGPAGWAAFLDGDVFVAGEIFLPELTLQVDHPAAPGERWYRRSAVGSFERLSVVSGNARTDASGVAVIDVPDLFARYHRDFRYQLTTVGAAAAAHVSRELRNGRFTVKTDRPRVKVSWQLTAVRDDPSARASEFRPTTAKRGSQRGRFLEPKVYGKSARRSIGGRAAGEVRRPSGMTASKERANRDD